MPVAWLPSLLEVFCCLYNKTNYVPGTLRSIVNCTNELEIGINTGIESEYLLSRIHWSSQKKCFVIE